MERGTIFGLVLQKCTGRGHRASGCSIRTMTPGPHNSAGKPQECRHTAPLPPEGSGSPNPGDPGISQGPPWAFSSLTSFLHGPSNIRGLLSSCEGSCRPMGTYRGGPWAGVLGPSQAAAKSTFVYRGLLICLLGGVKLRGLHTPPEPGLGEVFPKGRNLPPLSGSLPGLVSQMCHLHAQRRAACWAGNFSTAPFPPLPPQPISLKESPCSSPNWTVLRAGPPYP